MKKALREYAGKESMEWFMMGGWGRVKKEKNKKNQMI